MSGLETMAVPRWVERLLQSLGADPVFAEDVLGDLAEEFEVRGRWDGARAARRWYYREAVRTAPHLLRDWRRRFRLREAVPLTWALLAGFASSAALGALFARLTVVITGVPLSTWLHHVQTTGDVIPWLTAMVVAGRTIPSVIAGFVAGSVGRRAALPNCLLVSASLLVLTTTAVLIAVVATGDGTALHGVPMPVFVTGLVLSAGWSSAWCLAGGTVAALWRPSQRGRPGVASRDSALDE